MEKKRKGNRAVEYIHNMAKLMRTATEEQARYWNKKKVDTKAVQVTSARKILSPYVIEQILQIGIEAKQCYKNATHIALIDGFDYCEGVVWCDFPVEHAFNSYTDKNGNKYYFDFTLEFALNDDVEKWEYATIGEYSIEEVVAVCIETEVYGEIYWHEYEKTLR